jgi:hypothetical protein
MLQTLCYNVLRACPIIVVELVAYTISIGGFAI